MIKPNMIPDEVVEAAARELYDALCSDIDPLDWTEIGDWRQDEFRRQARASIAAALNAWPGVTTTSWFENSVRKAVLNIPLPLEARDE